MNQKINDEKPKNSYFFNITKINKNLLNLNEKDNTRNLKSINEDEFEKDLQKKMNVNRENIKYQERLALLL